RPSVERATLVFHYQPIVDLAKGRCVGVEALCRWQHPVRGLVAPGLFIPLAEENGFIRQIGIWTMQEAMHVISSTNGTVPVMSVNLSMRNLRGTDLTSSIAEILDRTGADAARSAHRVARDLAVGDRGLAASRLRKRFAEGPIRALDVPDSRLDDLGRRPGRSDRSKHPDRRIELIGIDGDRPKWMRNVRA